MKTFPCLGWKIWNTNICDRKLWLLHGEKSALLTRARDTLCFSTGEPCADTAEQCPNTSTPSAWPHSLKLEVTWTTSRIENKHKSLQEHRMSQRKSHYMWEWGRTWKWSRARRESILALLCRTKVHDSTWTCRAWRVYLYTESPQIAPPRLARAEK